MGDGNSSSPADIYMSSPDDYMDDDSNSNISSEDHRHQAIDNNINDDENDDDEELGKTCPTFTSKGKFIHYEYRAEEHEVAEGGVVKQQFVNDELQHECITNNTIHNTSSSQGGSTSKYSIWYLVIVTLLVAIIGISSATIYMARGTRNNENNSSSLTSSNNSSTKHTHPKKEHDPRNPTKVIDNPWEEKDPTKIPQQEHTHPKVDHSTPHDHPPNTRPFKNGQLGIAAKGSSSTTVTMFDNSDVVDVSSVAESISTSSTSSNNVLNDGKVHIEANAVSTITRSNPDYKWDGLQELGVEGDERISYIRFEYHNDYGNAQQEPMRITKAVLRLYLKTHRDDVNYATVQVTTLPYGGIWYDESLSWNNPPLSKDEYVVNTFLTKGSPFGVQLIEVDVTSSIVHPMMNKDDDKDDDGENSVTFKLSTESNGDYWFASRKWNGGEAVPELVLTLST